MLKSIARSFPFALLGLALPTHASPERQAQALLDALRQAGGVPGISAAVWQDGRMRWQGASGWRDAEQRLPVEAGTRFRMASISKLFAATAAAQLQAQGKLDATRPVGALLPELAPALAALTPTQLAAHLSGLPHYEASDTGRGQVHHATARESLSHLTGRALQGAPGSRYHYSSWGYTLLAAAVEAAAGQPYPALVRERVAPGLDIGPEAGAGMAKAYAFWGGATHPAPAHDFSYSWGGAALTGSAPALAEWGGHVLQGTVVDAATRNWMWQPVLDAAGQPVGERDFRMGFGWRLGVDAEGRHVVHHAGATLGARGVLLLWPEGEASGTSVSLMSNIMWTVAIERSAELLSAPFRAPVAGLAAQACPVKARRFEGDLDGVALAGSASFSRDAAGQCRGELGLPAALAKAVNPGPQPATDKLVVIGLQDDLARAALVTPIGLADWRAQADGSARVEGVAGRRLTLRVLE